MKFKFKELRVYQEAVLFANGVFILTKRWPSVFKFNLSDQFQRAALSVSLNIAEGSSRTKRDFQHFLTIARGSCYECIPILFIAKTQLLLKDDEYDRLYDQVNHFARMLTALKESIP